MQVSSIFNAMRADCIPAGDHGVWEVKRSNISQKDSEYTRYLALKGLSKFVAPGSYTWLFRWTLATLNQEHGEVVMNDFEPELRKHLRFIQRARGRVLVTGLGLGCVVRGLLACGKVESIDVIERDESVIRLCECGVRDPRVTLHHMDAHELKHGALPGRCWDFAWHDLWNDEDAGEPHLQLIHYNIMNRLIKRVKKQGAWALPRRFTRRIEEFSL